MSVVRAPSVLLVRVLVALVRDVAEALGAIVYGVGRAMLRLLSLATVVLIVYAILVRATVHVAMPPVVWPALAGVWLTATALWLVGGLLRCVARPRAGRAHVAAGVGTPPVCAQRIEEWEGAWRRALRYEQSGSRRAGCGRPRWGEGRRREAAGGAAGSPYEVLGVDRGASEEELRVAYRELAMRVHPDRNPGFVAEATDWFAAINAAYELLSDPERRAEYDRSAGADRSFGSTRC
jgi:DnaJ domain